MKLSIIIVNWNSFGFLQKCLKSLYTHLRNISFEVIVVDNASLETGIEGIALGYRFDIVLAGAKSTPLGL